MNLRTLGLAAIGVIVLVVIIVLIGSTCGNGGGLDKTVYNVADIAPEETTTLTHFDTRGIGGDDDLQEILENWELAQRDALEAFGLDTDRIEHIAHFTVEGKDLTIVKSRQDTSDLRQELEALGYDQGDFGKEHEEIWESPDGTTWLSITDEGILAGNKEAVMACIFVRDGADSLGDNALMAEVMDELPEGILVYLGRYQSNETYDGLEAVGASLDKKNSKSLKATFVYRFATAGQAEDVMDTLYYALDAMYDRPEIEQKGKLLLLEAEIDIDAADPWGITGLAP